MPQDLVQVNERMMQVIFSNKSHEDADRARDVATLRRLAGA